MRKRISFLSSLMILSGVATAGASECVGGGCDIGLINYAPASETVAYAAPVALPVAYSAPVAVAAPAAYAYPVQYVEPMVSVKSLSIKPVPEDRRPPVWDGTTGNYQARAYDKTVDWRDGVPIWDDSIVNYKYKDFSDWFLEPLPEIYERQVDAPSYQVPIMPMYGAATVPMAPVMPTMMGAPVYSAAATAPAVNPIDLYNQNMEDAAATRARVEELLNPMRPCGNLWTNNAATVAAPADDDTVITDITIQSSAPAATCAPMAPRPQYVAQDLTAIVNQAFGRGDGCPFDSFTECQIWRRKPIVRETVSPRSPQIRDVNVDVIVKAANCGKEISANDEMSAPLLDRYKMLMRSAQACCSDGMAYQLRKAGASDGLIYKFMVDDANFYGFGDRCLMMTDAELDKKYPNTSTAVVAADVRNGCLCRGRQWFQAMLAPFQQVYAASPEFKNQKFYYTYKDGLQREITVSVNNDVQNVLQQLSQCP